MYSSFCHMVFTWLEMFSHVLSRYWSLGFAGSVLHVENSLTALLIWPLQLNHMWQTEQSFLSSSSPMEAACLYPLPDEPPRKMLGSQSGSQSLAKDKERHEEKKKVLFSSNMCWDNSLKWKETRKTEQGLRKESSHCCCCFPFKIMILVWFCLLLNVSF